MAIWRGVNMATEVLSLSHPDPLTPHLCYLSQSVSLFIPRAILLYAVWGSLGRYVRT